MGLSADRPQSTLEQLIAANGFTIAYHDILKNGPFVPPEGMNSWPLGKSDPNNSAEEFFVYNPKAIAVIFRGPERVRSLEDVYGERSDILEEPYRMRSDEALGKYEGWTLWSNGSGNRVYYKDIRSHQP